LKGDISPLLAAGTKLFTGYDENWFRINDKRYNTGLSIHGNEVSAPWGPESLRGLNAEHLQPFIETPPEVLIIGTGRTTGFPDPALLELLADAHIGFECIDSRSAARTYNILVGEGRRVSVALLLPDAGR